MIYNPFLKAFMAIPVNFQSTAPLREFVPFIFKDSIEKQIHIEQRRTDDIGKDLAKFDDLLFKEMALRCLVPDEGVNEIVQAFTDMYNNPSVESFKGVSKSFFYTFKCAVNEVFVEFKFVSKEEITCYYPMQSRKQTFPLIDLIIHDDLIVPDEKIREKTPDVIVNSTIDPNVIPENLKKLYFDSNIKVMELSAILKTVNAENIVTLANRQFQNKKIKFLNTILVINDYIRRFDLNYAPFYQSEDNDTLPLMLYKDVVIVVGNQFAQGTYKEVSFAYILSTLKSVVEVKFKNIKEDALDNAHREVELLKKLTQNNPDLIPPYELVVKTKTKELVAFQTRFDSNGLHFLFVNACQIYTYFKNVSRGLAKIHADGFVHLDVKPANVLIRFVDSEKKTINTRVADIGHLREKDVISSGGTMHFLAPEFFLRGENVKDLERIPLKADPTMDSYALGIMMLNILTNYQYDNIHFAYQNDEGIKNMIDKTKESFKKRSFPFSEKLGFKMLDLIKGLLVVDPAKRSSCTYVHEELDKFVATL